MDKFRQNTRLFFSNKIGVAGLVILSAFIFVGIFGELIAPYDPNARVGLPFQPPSANHLLGTNDVGHDILSEILVGTRISLVVGILAATVSLILGSLVGLTAGYFGGRVEEILMRIVDVFLTIPMVPLLIVVAAFVGPGFRNMIIVIGALSWASSARTIRSKVLMLKNKGYIEAVRGLGGKPFYTIFRHILPATSSLIIAELILMSSRAVLLESTLSFLGLGDPTQKSWGMILYYAQARSAFLLGSWVWWILPPGLLITLLVVSFAFIGNALEQIANPRLR